MAESPLSPITPITPPRPRAPTVKAAPASRPAEAAPAAPAASTPAPAPAPTPAPVAPPPAAHPLGSPAAAKPATLKLKPVLRQVTAERTQQIVMPEPGATEFKAAPQLREVTTRIPEVALANDSPMDALKRVTQDLNGITAPISDSALAAGAGKLDAAALAAASKTRTARITISGGAPAMQKPSPTPTQSKTIRIKRPVVGGAPSPAVAPAPQPAAPAAAAPAAPAEAEKPAEEAAAETPQAKTPSTTVTQRKTLKIARPGKVAKPAAKPAGGDAEPSAEGEVADIPEMAEGDKPAAAAAAAPLPPPHANAGGRIADVPNGVAVMGLILQVAACAVMGYLGWCLYNDWQLPFFCGGCAL